MKQYIYETHLHTKEVSACARAAASDYIDYMIKRGFDGIIVTDHFVNGNSRIPYFLPWKDKVKWYVSGYENAKKAAKGKNFDVLFGIEYNFEGDEYLIYGVDDKWLYDNVDIASLPRREVYKRVHEGGGIMIQAHPYRERDYLSDIKLTPDICDGIEIYNAANEDYQNALGYEYALKLGLKIMTAGSDIHFFYDGELGGMRFDHRVETAGDYVESLVKGEGTPVRVGYEDVTPVTFIPSQIKTDLKPSLPIVMC